MTPEIPRKTRQDILQKLMIEGVDWSGSLTDDEFLSRIFDLGSMKSTDSRFKNAKGDIWQHTVNNPGDWGKYWVYSDPRFDLYKCPDDKFLSFLCETINPIVRNETNEREALLELYNKELSSIGIRIVERMSSFGKLHYEVEGELQNFVPATEDLKETATRLNSDILRREILRITDNIGKDPDLAVGTAKELVETACKTLLEKGGEVVNPKEDLPALAKLSLKKIMPVFEEKYDKEVSQSFKKMIGNLEAIVHSISEIRNIAGTGHGKASSHVAIETELARLAGNSAIASAMFFLSFLPFVSNTSDSVS